MEALDSKYNSLLLESPCQVEQIAFEYVPLGTGDGIHVTLTPAWRFLVKQELAFSGTVSYTHLQASQVVETTLSSGVVVQAEVSYPPVDFSSLASYQASLHRFDPQQARQLLLGDAPLAQEEQQAVKGSAFQDAMWHMYVTCLLYTSRCV